MKVEDFKDSELQMMRLAVKKVERLALYFEGSVKETMNYIRNVTLAPVSYIRGQSLGKLVTLVLEEGYPKAAKRLGVSEAFLKGEIKTRSKTEEIVIEPLELLSKKEVEDLIQRVPFITLLEAITGWKKFDIKRQFKLLRLETKSNLNTSRGRRAELIYKDFRGDKIKRDLNETVAQSEYDFDDTEYGRVNVKSAKMTLTKKGGRWYFPLRRDSKSDNYALVCYDEFGEIVLRLYMVNMSQVGDKSFIVKEDGGDEVGILLWKRAEEGGIDRHCMDFA
ncbi:MAG: hypothetical protein WAQ07_00710 [Candidatus Omnitrophota bacterium]